MLQAPNLANRHRFDQDILYYIKRNKDKIPKLHKKNIEKTPVGLDYLVNLGQEISRLIYINMIKFLGNFV